MNAKYLMFIYLMVVSGGAFGMSEKEETAQELYDKFKANPSTETYGPWALAYKRIANKSEKFKMLYLDSIEELLNLDLRDKDKKTYRDRMAELHAELKIDEPIEKAKMDKAYREQQIAAVIQKADALLSERPQSKPKLLELSKNMAAWSKFLENYPVSTSMQNEFTNKYKTVRVAHLGQAVMGVVGTTPKMPTAKAPSKPVAKKVATVKDSLVQSLETLAVKLTDVSTALG